ncbi:MAG: hypothetical protein WC708_12830 [Lentisphaeria bacterium]
MTGRKLAVLLCLRKDAVLQHATRLWRELHWKWGWAKLGAARFRALR